MKITPNLMFRTEARDAFTAYADIFGADRLDLVTYDDMPGAPVGPEWATRIAHAWLTIGDQALMGADCPPGVCADRPTEPDAGSVGLHFDTVERARAVFDRLAEDGTTAMPFGPTSWSPGFGMVRDRFGKDWMINTIAREPA